MSVFFVNADGEAVEAQQGVDLEVAQSDDSSPAQTEAQARLANFWPKIMDEIRKVGHSDFKSQALPLARIKKIMKLDGDVKMISAEAPMLFAKAAEIFIHELTLRAWQHTEDNKRRTLQRNDIAMAITKYDQFDFLIDIVPRDELKPSKPRDDGSRAAMNPDQVHYYFQLAQQHQQALQQGNTGHHTVSNNAAVQMNVMTEAGPSTSAQSAAVLASQQAAAQQMSQQSTGGIQIVQQIVTPTGELQQIPIQLTQQQLNMIRMQMQGNSNQPIVIQTAPIQTTGLTGQPQIIQMTQQNNGQVFLQATNLNEAE